MRRKIALPMWAIVAIKKYFTSYFKASLVLRHFALASVLAIAGCGGDGSTPAGDNSDTPAGSIDIPTDTNTSFNLFPPSYFSLYKKTMVLSGSDNTGIIYTMVFTEQNLSQTTFLSAPAIPIRTQTDLENFNTGGFVSEISNNYFSTTAGDRHLLGSDGATTTVLATTTAIPPTAKIGDFGNIGTYTDNVTNVENISWKLEDGFNGDAKLVLLFNFVDGSEEQTFLISPNGTRKSLSIVLFSLDTGITITLSGS